MTRQSRSRWVWGLLAFFLTVPPIGQAVGTVTLTSSRNVGRFSTTVYRQVYAWTSDSMGDVSGDSTTIVSPGGYLVKVETQPGTGGTMPTDNYDVTLKDTRSIDILDGLGANRDNAAPDGPITNPGGGLWTDPGEGLQLVVANAGSAKTGQISLWFAYK